MVAIIMGSRSDAPKLKTGSALLSRFGIEWEAKVLSAHRTPEALEACISALEGRKCSSIIAAAGLSAHLAGVIASKTLIPVIGVPLKTPASALDGLDAVLSMLQMPGGVPVAVVGLDNGINAALLAARIIAVHDGSVRTRLAEYIEERKQTLLSDEQGEVL
jgi:5-(carboxyamino)imidazole ribonucleotide mutase